MSSWEDLTDDLTDEGKARVQVGQLLRFDYEGSMVELKITRKTVRKDGSTHVFAKHVTTSHPDEVNVVETIDGHTETMNIGEML